MKKNYPSEEAESVAFVQWLNLIELPNHHSANEMPAQRMIARKVNGKPLWQPNWGRLSRLKAMGVSSGFPDHLVIVPPEKSKSGRALLLAIEMKRIKGGVTSSAQKEWLRLLGQVQDCEGFICKGAEEAIETVQQFIK